MAYRAPVADYRFIFRNVVDFQGLGRTGRFEDADIETCEEVLEAAGDLAVNVLAPLQRHGDLEPARIENGVVRPPPRYAEGYDALAKGGWIGMAASPEFGGSGLPVSVQNAVNEFLNGACISLGLNVLLTQAQIEALSAHADENLKKLFLPKLASGEWCGTMNMTEPQAGSDIGSLTTKAVEDGGGRYRITGQKILISWADADFAENICHLVLARLPDAPGGSKGISLFLVPKRLVGDDGKLGHANAVRIVSLERKLGLHGSPTAVVQFDGAEGWMVGKPNSGLSAMFTMMNGARLGVGTQGVAIAEAAAQMAEEFAVERVQGRPLRSGGTGAVIDHADVRRSLMLMKAQVFAARSICASCAIASDLAAAGQGERWAERAALLTPIAKCFGSDTGVEVALRGIQLQGGSGYVEESGAAQFLRDVMVTTIYEGTNGIQAMDLAGRKLADGGRALIAMLDEVDASAREQERSFPVLARRLIQAKTRFARSAEWMAGQSDLNARFAGSRPFLRALALLLGADAHLRAFAAVEGSGPRASLAQVYFTRILPGMSILCEEAEAGDGDLYSGGPDQFGVPTT